MATTPRLDEFQRIARFFAPLAGAGALGLKDDAALIDGPAGTEVRAFDRFDRREHPFSSGTTRRTRSRASCCGSISRISRPRARRPSAICWRSPCRPRATTRGSKAFSRGLAEDQKRFGMTLLGGDSVHTEGPTTLTVTAIGKVATGKAMLRSGARGGDRLYVSGTLGDAAFGLKVLQGELKTLSAAHREYLIARYRIPEPKLGIGTTSFPSASPRPRWIFRTGWSPISVISAMPPVSARLSKPPRAAAIRCRARGDRVRSVVADVGSWRWRRLRDSVHGTPRVPVKMPVTEIGRYRKAGKG